MAAPGGPSPVTVSPDAFLAMGREVLSKQPFSVLLGAQVDALEPGRCELAIPIAEHHKQQHGFVHGGVLAYLADNALTYAGGTALRVPVLTGEFKINYVRPAIGERLVARATAVHVGKTQAVCRCDVFAVGQAGERLCAMAQGTIVAAPEQSSM